MSRTSSHQDNVTDASTNTDTVHKPDQTSLLHILQMAISQLKFVSCLTDEAGSLEDGRTTRNFVYKTLLIASEELKSKGTFNVFKEIVDSRILKLNQVSVLKDEIKRSKMEYRSLKKSLKEMKLSEKELQKKDRVIEEQNIELERLTAQNEYDLEFTKQLLSTQVEENELKAEIEEVQLKKMVEGIIEEMKGEEKVHMEVMFYYENELKRVNDLITHWKDRYVDIGNKKQELKDLTAARNEQREKLDYYQHLYKTRNAEMEEYLADKERRRKEHEHELYLNRMATKIQCWWRGVMVRRCLGPFKHLLKSKNAKKRKMSLKRGPGPGRKDSRTKPGMQRK